MRTVQAVAGIVVAALAPMTAPALAKNSNAQQTEEKPAPSGCHSLQPRPDGTWVEIPCQELGSPAPMQGKPEGRSAEQANH